MADIGKGFGNLTRKIKNAMPTTKWPLIASIYTLYDGTKLRFSRQDFMRPETSSGGKLFYLLKSTGEQFIPPKGGIEDATGAVTLIRVGDGDYRYTTFTYIEVNMELAETSKKIVLELTDDETMKYLYAEQIDDNATRARDNPPWYNTFAVIFLIFIIACIIFWTIGSSVAYQGVSEATNVMQQASQAMSSAANALATGASSVNRPPV